ncbi:MAG: META domain-containing protein [Microbacteriaceae bacterium]|nr:META domain-containing protein [Microbacteriaceae bacterium]
MTATRNIVASAVALLAVSTLLAGCAPASSTPGGAAATGPIGVWGETAPEAPQLDLHESGQFWGTDGCNRLVGSWTSDGDAVDFGDVIAQTRMHCEGVDTWLEGMRTGRVEGSSLVILDDSGAEIGTLERQP